MSSSIRHGRHLEVTVVGCNVFSECRSHPLFVGLQYGANIRVTLPNHDGRMDPTFPNKFEFPLIEGESDLKFVVWKNINNNLPYDDFLGSSRVQLHNVISKGFEESYCPLRKGSSGNIAGELKLVLRCTHIDSHSENIFRDPTYTASYLHPSYIHHPLPFLPPSSYYQPPLLYPSPPQLSYYQWPPYLPPPPTSPSPPYYLSHYPVSQTCPTLQLPSQSPSQFPSPSPSQLPSQLQSPSPSQVSLFNSIFPFATLGSALTSIAANMFQVFFQD